MFRLIDLTNHVKISSEKKCGVIAYFDLEKENNLKCFSKFVEMKTCSEKAQISSRILSLTQGEDFTDSIVSRLKSYIDIKVDREVYSTIFDVASRRVVRISKWKSFVHSLLKTKEIYYVSTPDEAQRLLFQKSLEISSSSKQGDADFFILPRDVVALLEESPAFVHSNESEEVLTPTVYMGTLGTKFKIFYNADFSTNLAIGGKSSRNSSNAGIYYVEGGEHVENYETMENSQESPPSQVVGYALDYAVVEVGNSLENNFLLFNIKAGKKPLWRRLLFI